VRLLAAALCALAAAGCTAAQGLIASPSDYTAYRATRVAPTFEERLAAAERYLEEHKDGRYKDEVRAFFDPAEEAFWATKKDTKASLRGYLELLPRGPHHEAAERRIGQIEVAERSAAAEVARSAAEVEARVSGRAAADRARVRAEIEGWLRIFLDRKLYEAPLSAARAEAVVPLALSLPSPRCALSDPPEGAVSRRCTKLLELPFVVQAERGEVPHEAIVEITLAQDERGVPLEATVGGPDLFVRFEETHRVKPIAPGDAAARAAAVSRAVEEVSAVFGQAVSDAPGCRRRPVPGTALELACNGMRVTVAAAKAAGEDDRVVIRPLF